MTKKTTLRFHEVDFLRFLAAIFVVLYHYTFENSNEYSSLESYPALGEIFKYGYLGVEFFFMISGFVILLTASKKDWKGFIVSRLSRLYPSFWISLTLTTLGIVFFSNNVIDVTLKEYLLNLTMLGSMVGVENIDGVYWTLQVEIKFYFWILVILLFNKIKHIEYFIAGWLVLSALEVFHILHVLTNILFIPQSAPYFSAGALFYLLYTKGYSATRLGLLAVSYSLGLYYVLQGAMDRTEFYNLEFSSMVAAGMITLFFAIFALIAMKKTSHIYYSWFAILGAISYPLYLLHQTLGQVAFLALAHTMNKYLLLLLITGAMILIAYLLHRYLEIGLSRYLKQKLELLLNRKSNYFPKKGIKNP